VTKKIISVALIFIMIFTASFVMSANPSSSSIFRRTTIEIAENENTVTEQQYSCCVILEDDVYYSVDPFWEDSWNGGQGYSACRRGAPGTCRLINCQGGCGCGCMLMPFLRCVSCNRQAGTCIRSCFLWQALGGCGCP